MKKLAPPIFTLCVVLAFVVGCLVGFLPDHGALKRCRAEKEVLTADLTRAVARGVTVETNLNLCKEQKRCSK